MSNEWQRLEPVLPGPCTALFLHNHPVFPIICDPHPIYYQRRFIVEITTNWERENLATLHSRTFMPHVSQYSK